MLRSHPFIFKRLNIINYAYLLKGYTARYLRQEFSELIKMPPMWTRSYFCSTAGNVSSATIAVKLAQAHEETKRVPLE